ncbi:MAG: nucleoside triphosphate pyrophosphohydrolase family protein [Chitinophagales bacterium]|nr:nucleoside triphosphate pyrophosphohydrolase family protein [Chitinophagales bacterium]
MKKFNEPNALSDVALFHDTFNAPILNEATIPSAERCALRVSLLQEELNELKEAIADKNIVEIADALADLQYVLSGAILEFGLANKFKEIFDEVQRSNMSKACSTKEEAEATQLAYQKKDGTISHIIQKEDKYLVYREGDNKVLKSVHYSPADLKSILAS